MKILAIESSCDETAAAVVEDGHRVLGEAVATQVDIHRKYGGVVPELASRNHVVDIVPIVEQCLADAGLTGPALDAVAVTRGPGLVGALLVGLQVAKGLAYAWDKPLIPVHHLAGHLHAVFLHRPDEPRPPGPAFPHVALAVSGGHTALYLVRAPGRATMIANTRDDAAGEAFDKVARMLGLGYPGGPVVDRMAAGGDAKAHRFTRPLFKDGSMDFSFSGLKTAVRTVIRKGEALPEGQALTDLLASFQAAVADQLIDRTVKAARRHKVRDVALVGGVAANSTLREGLRAALADRGMALHVPPRRWCTDNAAMIAGAAFAEVEGLGAHHVPADRRLNATGSWPLPA
ncbi:MAG: tRNA (adenosine(37)-N6)-threonylcarbamoyltransferase complex transferase subunit TsaD [Myxococcales bacterium]|nr:tRNA (adenosine(37)-N6)-threonylcarbamoyltransferase complex transferase subunit TsaD [Myxococcales bacterium]